MPVGETLQTLMSAAPELAKTPSLALSVAQAADPQAAASPTAKQDVQATAHTTALALALHGMKMAAQNITEALSQPEEPEPTL